MREKERSGLRAKFSRSHKITASLEVGAVLFGLGAGFATKEWALLYQSPTVTSVEIFPENGMSREPSSADINKIKENYDSSMARFRKWDNALSERDGSILDCFAWPLSRAIDASQTMTLLPGGEKYQKEYLDNLAQADKYWAPGPEAKDVPSYGPADFLITSNESYTDDNLWLGIAQIREYERSGDPHSLEHAKGVFELIKTSWDEEEGGVYWKQQRSVENSREKGVVSNAPSVILAVELYQKTGDPSYLEWGEKIFDWTNKTLRDPADGLYFDNINKGVIQRAKWSYNQGTMIGAMEKLSEVDPVKYPLKNALDLANKELDRYSRGDYKNEDIRFRAIEFRRLLILTGKVNDPVFTEKVLTELQRQVSKETKGYKNLVDEASRLEMQALLAVPESKYGKL